jgi:hypothetical protein
LLSWPGGKKNVPSRPIPALSFFRKKSGRERAKMGVATMSKEIVVVE